MRLPAMQCSARHDECKRWTAFGKSQVLQKLPEGHPSPLFRSGRPPRFRVACTYCDCHTRMAVRLHDRLVNQIAEFLGLGS